MPVIPKPVKKPLWATIIGVYGGRINAIEPPVGRQPEGWQFDEDPPRNYDNWHRHWVGEWINYLEAEVGAGQRAATFVIAAETASDEWKQGADYVVGAGADASLVIEAAVAAMPAMGGRILLSDGVFNCQTQLDFDALAGYVVVQGQGPGTLLAYAQAGSGTLCLVQNSEFVQFRDLAFWPALGGHTWITGLRVASSKVLLHACKLGRFWSDDSGTILDPRGVAVWGSGSEVLLSDCDVRLDVTGPAYSEYGVAATNGSRFLLHGSRIWAAGAAGVGKSTRAALAADGSVVLAQGCFIERAYQGVLLSGSGCADSLITGCEIKDTAERGIFLEGAILVGVHGNAIRTAGTVGIEADGTSGKVSIQDNLVFDPGFDGIVVAGSYCKACDNTISSCRDAIVLSGDSNIVTGNQIDTSSNDGISVTGDENIVDGNRIDGSAIGIEIVGGYNHVHDNQVVNSSAYHIAIRQAGANNSVCDNMALPGGVLPPAGLYHEHDSARNNLVSGNYLRGCGNPIDLWIQGAYANVLVLPAIVGVDATNANACVNTSEAA